VNLSQLSEAAATTWDGLESSYSFQPTWWHREDRPAVHVFRLQQAGDRTYQAEYVGNLELSSTATATATATAWIAFDLEGGERQVETSA
jgi:hypothetical protein